MSRQNDNGRSQNESAEGTVSEKTGQLKGALPVLSPRGKFWLGFAVIAVLVCAVLVGFYCLKTSMFERNPHFVIRKVCIGSVSPSGVACADTYWSPKSLSEKKQREKSLCSLLQIDLNSTNTFSKNLGEMRRKVLKEHPELADLTIQREMPDTLHFILTERLMVFAIEGVVNGRRLSPCYVSDDYVIVGKDRVKDICVPRVIARGKDPDFDALQIGADVSRNSFIRQVMGIVKLVTFAYPSLKMKLLVYCPQEECIRCTAEYQDAEYCLLFAIHSDAEKINKQLSFAMKQLNERVSMSNGVEIDLRINNQFLARKKSQNQDKLK